MPSRVAQPCPADLIASMLDVGTPGAITRAEIARRTGLSRSYITHLTNGERGRRVSWATLTALQRCADTTLRRHGAP